ncbi:hypothetical protein M758_UG196400 [Ceratodon purpureus]|nr:hypothetical protein M758_UG196400 [Ceratodon purpureus]
MSAMQYPCTFVKESRKCMKNNDHKQVRAESAVEEIRVRGAACRALRTVNSCDQAMDC